MILGYYWLGWKYFPFENLLWLCKIKWNKVLSILHENIEMREFLENTFGKIP